MKARSKFLTSATAAAILLLAIPGLADAQVLQGMIISHDGDTMVVRSSGDVDTKVKLSDTTKVQAVVGLIGARREDHPVTDLIRGLAVDIEGVQNGDEIEATTITFKPGDLKTAQAVQAGTAQAKERIIEAQKENDRRLSQVGQFETKGSTRVFFPTGSAAINAQGKQDLQAIAQQAAANPGYLIRVVGHADSTGSPAANQRLSDQRASAVTAYLLHYCNVQPNVIVGSAGMGDYVPLETTANEPGGGNAQNRRVTVFLVASKAAQKATPTSY